MMEVVSHGRCALPPHASSVDGAYDVETQSPVRRDENSGVLPIIPNLVPPRDIVSHCHAGPLRWSRFTPLPNETGGPS